VAKHELRELQDALAGTNEDKERKQKELTVMAEQLASVRRELKAEKEERRCKMTLVKERLGELTTK
jgi:hypothetical protein